MKTAVIQSYRRHDCPAWMALALRSVEAWAKRWGYDYIFLGDEFFDYAPPWARSRCGNQILPVTDVARLYLLDDCLSKGYERVVWFDADIVVFDPSGLAIPDGEGYAFCREVILGRDARGTIRISPPGVNNAGMSFCRGNPMLGFYRLAAERILAEAPPGEVERTLVGPDLLSGLGKLMPLSQFRNIGLFTPLLMEAVASGNKSIYRAYAQQFDLRLAAANLCHSFRPSAESGGQENFDRMFERAVEHLLNSRGRLD